MKNIIYFLIFTFLTTVFYACNKEWTEEQFVQTISIKSSPNNYGVTNIPVRYKEGGEYTYNVPVIVSGSTNNCSTRNLHFSVDADTLDILNFDKFGNKEILYFSELPAKYFSFPETLVIPESENIGLLPVTFKMSSIDESVKWVLPIRVDPDPTGENYVVNTRKYYDKILIRPILFNDFSGKYAGTQLLGSINNGAKNLNTATIRTYVVSENKIFFYAGESRTENSVDRQKYKVYLEFTDEVVSTDANGIESKKVIISSDTDNSINFQTEASDIITYTIQHEMDPLIENRKHIYIKVSGIKFCYTDNTTTPNSEVEYTWEGSISLQRDIDINFPDEQQTGNHNWW